MGETLGARSLDWKWRLAWPLPGCCFSYYIRIQPFLDGFETCADTGGKFILVPSSSCPSRSFFNTLLMIYVSKYILHRFRVLYARLSRVALMWTVWSSSGKCFSFLNNRIGYHTVYIDIFTWMNRDERTNTSGITKFVVVFPPKMRNLFAESKDKLKYPGEE